MRRKFVCILTVLTSAALGPYASAESTTGASHTIVAYGKVGGLIPVSKLGPHLSFRLGGGYLAPWRMPLQGRLGVMLDLGYSQTAVAETITDARIGEAADGSFSYSLTQRDLNLFVGPQYFIRLPTSGRGLAPYIAAGLDLHFLESVIEGTGEGNPLGDNRETSTKLGFAVRGGVGYRLGPGLVTGEVTFAWAPIDHDITGESHLGRLAVLLGYAAMIGL